MATVKGTTKVDKFTVNASNVIVVTGKKTSTNKISKNGKNRIYGAAAKDTFTVKGGKLNYIYGDAGNDTITVTSKIGSGNRIYGDDAKDKVSGNDTFNINVGSKNYFYGGKGVDTFNVNGGTTNYIYGGAGNDVIVIGKTSTGTAIVKDFSVKSGNKDTVKVTGGAVKSIAVSGKNMIVKGGKSASVTLEGAKSKTFTVTDTLGSYTVAGANIKLALGKNVKGTVTAASFITTVDGRSDANAITINGNAKNNTIYGGAGINVLNGGAGNDTLSGGAGKDTFVYANGQGADTITDYVAGQDTLQFSSGSISKTAIANGGKDLVFTVGNGSITLQNAATKSVSLKDSRGSYTASNTAIILASNFTGTMDATKYLASVTTIDGRNAAKAVNITGNARNNTIYAGKAGGTLNGGAGNDTLYGGVGNDTLTGGAGNDTFVYVNGQGNDTITDYIEGQDTLQISSGSISEATLANSNKDVVFTVGTGSITLQNAATKTISLKDSNGSYTASDVAITLGSDFVGTMDATKYLSSVTTIDGRNATKAVNITGNAQNNTIYAGKAGGTINGGAGNDTLYGGTGKDTFVYAGGKESIYNYVSGSDTIKLSSTTLKSTSVSGEDTILNLANGGTITVKNAANADIYIVDSSGNSVEVNSTVSGSNGADTFVYNSTAGNMIVTDYTEGEDALQIADAEITKVESIDGNIVLTVGDEGNTITLEGVAGKSIEIHNSNGGLTLSEDVISLGSDYTGDIDANAYLPTVTTIDGRNAEGTVNITGNVQNNTIYAGKAGGTLNGGAGNDKLYGGAGKDTFVYASGAGSDTIKDFEESQDTLEISGSVISSAEVADGNMVLTVGFGSVTLEDASDKTVQLQDARGRYTVSADKITLGADFTGTLNSSVFMSTIETIDGSAADGTVDITGNAQNNTIYAGQAGGTINGGIGDDIIYGNIGRDTFEYALSNGNDIIKNYTEDQDSLKITDGVITNMKVYNENIDFYVGTREGAYKNYEGIITLVDSAEKKIKIQSENGSFTISNTEILLGTDYEGDIKVRDFNNSIVLLDGRDSQKVVNIAAGNNDSILYAGKIGGTLRGGQGSDTLYSGLGDDVLYGGSGSDTFIYSGVGNDTIKDYNNGFGTDTLMFSGGTLIDTYYLDEGNNFVFKFGDNDSLTLTDIKNSTITVDTGKGSYSLRNTELTLGNTFYGMVMDTKVFPYIINIDARDVTNSGFIVGNMTVMIRGNEQDNIMYASDNFLVQLDGGAGNDRLYGGKGFDFLFGGSGDDHLYGKEGNDDLRGYDGNDWLYGEEGNDELYGDDGNDDLNGGNGDDYLYGGSGNDNLTGDDDNDILSGDDGDDRLYGKEGNDELYGGAGNDYLDGGAGDDKLYGDDLYWSDTGHIINHYGAGDDHLHGGDGNDSLYGGDGNDWLYGGAGKDYLYGGSGNDHLLGDDGEDVLSGDDGNDVIWGGVGKDIIYGGSGDDSLYGDDGDDKLFGSTGDDSLHGDDGDDWLYGEEGNDYLDGDAGNDYLYGGTGEDNLHGGAGDDNLNGDDGDDFLYGYIGNDILIGGKGNDTLYGGKSPGEIYGSDAYSAGVYRGDGNDILIGNEGNDTLYGGDRDDELYGGEGYDKLYGEDGSDKLFGGAGDNKLYANYGNSRDTYRDEFYFDTQSTGTNEIFGFTPGTNYFCDAICFVEENNAVGINDYFNEASDAIVQLTNGGIVRIVDCANQTINIGGSLLDFSKVK